MVGLPIMENDPKPQSDRPGSSEPDDALDLLRALARTTATPEKSGRPEPARQAASEPAQPAISPRHPGDEPEAIETLRLVAHRLGQQLRALDRPAGPDARPVPRAKIERAPQSAGGGAKTRTSPPFLRRAHAKLAIIAGLSILLVAGLLAVMWKFVSSRDDLVSEQTPGPTQAAVTPGLAAGSDTRSAVDVQSIANMMAACDMEAAKDPDTLYFFVLPLTQADASKQAWPAPVLQTIGDSVRLLGANDALDGLRTGALAVRQERYTFAILDAATATSFDWTSATGISRLAKRNAQSISALKLGFDFSDKQKVTQWSNEFKRDRGTCYWVSALIRG